VKLALESGETPTEHHLVSNLLPSVMGAINNRDTRRLEEGTQRWLERSNLNICTEGGDLSIDMCGVPDVGDDFLWGNSRKGATILCTTVDEIRETRIERSLTQVPKDSDADVSHDMSC